MDSFALSLQVPVVDPGPFKFSHIPYVSSAHGHRLIPIAGHKFAFGVKPHPRGRVLLQSLSAAKQGIHMCTLSNDGTVRVFAGSHTHGSPIYSQRNTGSARTIVRFSPSPGPQDRQQAA